MSLRAGGANPACIAGLVRSRRRWWLPVLFSLGMVVRVGGVLWQHTPLESHEPVSIAISLAVRGAFADPFADAPTGPTAHTAPLYPLMMAPLIRVFGTGWAGSFAISILACAGASLAFALLPELSLALGLGAAPGLAGGLAGEIVILTFWAQTKGAFETSYTALCLVGLGILMGRCVSRREYGTWPAAGLGIAGGIAALVHPVALPVLFGWLALAWWMARDARRAALRFAALACLATTLTMAPWAVRNRLALGSFVWTRSNFGLELALSNNDFSHPLLDDNLRDPRAFQHPFVVAAERDRVRRAGEVRYNSEKLHEALVWIREHPGWFCRLTAERALGFWFPPMLRWWQTAAEAALTLLALAGLVLMTRPRPAAAALLAWALLGASVIYYVVQVNSRYRMPVEPLLFLLAGYAVAHLARSAGFARPTALR